MKYKNMIKMQKLKVNSVLHYAKYTRFMFFMLKFLTINVKCFIATIHL